MSEKDKAQQAAAQICRELPQQKPTPATPCQGSEYPEKAIICRAICECKQVPLSQICVTKALWGQDDVSGNTSTIKAEVPYYVTPPPPTPIMSRNNPKRATRRRPAGSKIPDVIIVKDGNLPPTQDNILRVVEIKFPPDPLTDDQEKNYLKIAGDDAEFDVLEPGDCGCPGKRVRQPVTTPVPVPESRQQPSSSSVSKPGTVEVVLLSIALIALVLDDAIPAGATQADDALIPGVAARLLMAF